MMNTLTYGDMAQASLLRRQNVMLKAELSQLTHELSSGEVQDVTKHLSGDLGYLAEVEHSLHVSSAFASAASEAATVTDAMQAALDLVSSEMEGLLSGLFAAAAGGTASTRETVSDDVAGRLSLIMSALNTDVAGRSIFAGQDTNTRPLVSAADLLSELRNVLAGQTTAAGVMAIIDDWFDNPGGGFETSGYQGSTVPLSPFQLGAGAQIGLDIRADAPAFRTALKAMSLAVLATDESLGFDGSVQAELFTTASENLLAAQDWVTVSRGKLGSAQARIEEVSTRLTAERLSLELVQSELLSADPYETVTRIEEAQFKLEALYNVTARMSRLSLMEYMR